MDFNPTISNSNYLEYKKWFQEYVSQFHSQDVNMQKIYDLKAHHTDRVCEIILDLAHSLNLTDDQCILAETIALFHDLGRFEQFRKYGTFADRNSINHSKLAIEILEQTHRLTNLSEELQKLIITSISYHNCPNLPSSLTDPLKTYAQLIRDADKLDIYYVVTEFYRKKLNGEPTSQEDNNSIELGLIDSTSISKAVYNAIMHNQVVLNKDLKTVNDFKVLQLAWVYDLNFPRSVQFLKQKGYLKIILQSIPQSKEKSAIEKKFHDYLS
jgi:HD superfamily phosphodiesterase